MAKSASVHAIRSRPELALPSSTRLEPRMPTVKGSKTALTARLPTHQGWITEDPKLTPIKFQLRMESSNVRQISNPSGREPGPRL